VAAEQKYYWGGGVRGCEAANYPREAVRVQRFKIGGNGGGKGGRLKPPISATLGPTNPKLDSCMCLVCKSNKLALFGNYDSIPNLMCSTSFHFCILKSWYYSYMLRHKFQHSNSTSYRCLKLEQKLLGLAVKCQCHF